MHAVGVDAPLSDFKGACESDPPNALLLELAYLFRAFITDHRVQRYRGGHQKRIYFSRSFWAAMRPRKPISAAINSTGSASRSGS